eukprot:gene10087-13554_t
MIEDVPVIDESIFQWGSIQSHILTGGGILELYSKLGQNYQLEDLPHYWIRHGSKIAREKFIQWKSQNLVSLSIVGSWSRPLFSGGWMESTDTDTLAYNLQTPSVFIDMRFPASLLFNLLSKQGSLNNCSNFELRLLSRQHCFAGYSFPTTSNNMSIFTRHHIIDWNFHPLFPRNRPNQWFIQLQPLSPLPKAELNNTAPQSFKEYSTVRDEHNIPIYFERWQRIVGDSDGSKYLAIRKVLSYNNNTEDDLESDSLLIIMGNHFSFVNDRKMTSVVRLLDGVADKSTIPKAGGGALVDFLLSLGSEGRVAAIDWLSVEGSFGLVKQEEASWVIQKSTHPWREGQPLMNSQGLNHDNKIYLTRNYGNQSNGVLKEINSDNSIIPDFKNQHELLSLHWKGSQWEIIENSFTIQELEELFNVQVSLDGKPPADNRSVFQSKHKKESKL